MRKEVEFLVDQSPQRGEFTFSELDPMEHFLIDMVVNWRNPNTFKDYVWDIHGRSIVFASPERQIDNPEETARGNYNGLQLIGAGGSKDAIHDGLQKHIVHVITPVNPTNHAAELDRILEVRDIDENGQLQKWKRPYAPLHGMTTSEAENRKTMTQHLRNFLASYHQNGDMTFFTVPELAAEGIFPDKKAPDGTPLHFQVYRVPLLDRFPGQLAHAAHAHGNETSTAILAEFSFIFGKTLRLMHALNLAYMDGHLGNMSILKWQSGTAIYITDLGSILDISKSSYQDRYRGFDFYTHLESTYRYLSHYCKFLEDVMSIGKSEKEEIWRINLPNAALGLIEGYFQKEIAASAKSKKITLKEVKDIMRQQMWKLLEAYVQYRAKPQKFLEFFEEYFRSFGENFVRQAPHD